MSTLLWKVAPRKEGYYWVRKSGQSDYEAEVYKVFYGGPLVWYAKSVTGKDILTSDDSDNSGYVYSGPIYCGNPPPEAAEEK